MTRIDEAIALAVEAHKDNKLDEDGQPHIVHCMSVMVAVKNELEEIFYLIAKDALKKYTVEELVIAAILHDSVEDSEGKVTLEMIRQRFGDNIAHIVDCLTRRGLGKGETKEFYRDFLYRCKSDPGARLIKIKDLHHNMGRTCKIAASKAKWKAKLDYKYSVAWRCIYDDDLSWEASSWEAKWEEVNGVNTPRFFIADPNGKRIEISKAEFEALRDSWKN
jgi:(p)ppGpp synthase/HD superfamily hydrolase